MIGPGAQSRSEKDVDLRKNIVLNRSVLIRGVDDLIAYSGTFHNDRHPQLEADFVFADPCFDICDWAGQRQIGRANQRATA